MNPSDLDKSREPDWTWYWGVTSPLISKSHSWYTSKICLRLFRDLDIKTCLELGGGLGLTAKIIAQKLNLDLTLVDNNPKGYELFKRYSNYGRFILEDFFRFRPKQEFDLVYSIGVIEHYSDREERIEVLKIHRRLSQKYVGVLVPKNSWLVRNFAHLNPKHGYEKLYSKEELEGEVRAANLKPLRFEEDIHLIGFLCSV